MGKRMLAWVQITSLGLHLLFVLQPTSANNSTPTLYADNAEYGDSLNGVKVKDHHGNYVVGFRKPDNASDNENGMLRNFLVSLKEQKSPSADFLKEIDIRAGAKQLSSHFVKLAKEDMGAKKLQVCVMCDFFF